MEKAALKGMFASGKIPIGSEYKSALTDVLNAFPYFQLAQVLFAKQMYDTHEPEASGRIRLASVYAPDRKAMYLLFKTHIPDSGIQPVINKDVSKSDEPKNQDKTEVKYNFIYSSSTAKNVETASAPVKVEAEPMAQTSKKILQTEVFIRKELETKLPVKTPPEKPAPTEAKQPELAKAEIKKKEDIVVPPIEKEKMEQLIAKTPIIPPIEKSPPAIVVNAEEKKPETEITMPVVNEPISDSSLKYSFTAWLRVIPEISIPQEKPISPVNQQEKSAIIDEFLRKAPSISRPKAEFFSSVKAAKMSIAEDENLVSETLAKIYVTQGNLQKALKAYQILLVQFPEKKNIFAPRIEEIKALIRENTKPTKK